MYIDCSAVPFDNNLKSLDSAYLVQVPLLISTLSLLLATDMLQTHIPPSVDVHNIFTQNYYLSFFI